MDLVYASLPEHRGGQRSAGEVDVASVSRPHHRMVHAGKLEILMIGGRPHFRDQYGNDLYEGRRRPPPSVGAA